MKKIIIAAAVFFSSEMGIAQALDSWTTWSTNQPYVSKQVPPNAMIMRGKGTDEYFVLEVDPATGAIPVEGSIVVNPPTYTYATSVYYSYGSGSVGTGAWVEIEPSFAANAVQICVTDTGGQVMQLGIGGSGSEQVMLLIARGWSTCIPQVIASGSRLSLKAVSGTASSGEFVLTSLNEVP